MSGCLGVFGFERGEERILQNKKKIINVFLLHAFFLWGGGNRGWG